MGLWWWCLLACFGIFGGLIGLILGRLSRDWLPAVLLRIRMVGLVSETRREYVHVGSRPASLRGTVSETDLTTPALDCGTQVLGARI